METGRAYQNAMGERTVANGDENFTGPKLSRLKGRRHLLERWTIYHGYGRRMMAPSTFEEFIAQPVRRYDRGTV